MNSSPIFVSNRLFGLLVEKYHIHRYNSPSFIMRKLFFILLPLLAFSLSAFGQTYIQNTQYPFSRFVYNPAEAGSSDDIAWRFSMIGRLQWIDVPGNPQLGAFSVERNLEEQIGGGVGAYLIFDELGPLRTTGLNLAYSFHTDLDFGKLNIGVQVGALQKSINAIWQYRGMIDPIIGPANTTFSSSVVVPNLGFGLMYSHYDKVQNYTRFFVGISGMDLLEPSIENLLLDPSIAPVSRVPRSFYLMGGYRFDLDPTERNFIQPTILARTDFLQTQFDLSVYWHYKVMMFGVSHRWRDSFSGIIGFELSDRLFMGYSYDYTLSALGGNGQGASHEIVLSFFTPKNTKSKVKIRDILDGRIFDGSPD
jgi:type IX secretion system PorP/SprF family membrane protein